MEQTTIVNTALTGMTAMMLPTMFASLTPDMAGAAALWATAVWGTKPASDPGAPRTLKMRGCNEWTSPLNVGTAGFLRDAVKTARYGNN